VRCGEYMDQQCAGSGRELPGEPPPDTAVACPECGREVRIDVQEAEHGQRVVIEDHQGMVDVSG